MEWWKGILDRDQYNSKFEVVSIYDAGAAVMGGHWMLNANLKRSYSYSLTYTNQWYILHIHLFK